MARHRRQRGTTRPSGIDKTMSMPGWRDTLRRGGWPLRLSVGLILALSMGFAGTQLVLPYMVENQLVASIQKSAGPAKLVQVDIQTYPAWQLLQGKVDKLTVDVRQARINNLDVEAFLVDARNMIVDTQALRQGKGLAIKAADSLQVSAVISEKDLNAFLHAKDERTRSFSIQLRPEWTGLKGSVTVLGYSIGVDIKGHFSVMENQRVVFHVDEVVVEKTMLPRFLINAFIPPAELEINLAKAPVPLEVRDLRVGEGRLFIYGQRPKNLPQTGAGSK